MSKVGDRHLTTIDAFGHGTDGEHAVGQRFPIDPPFGLVAMAWREPDFVQSWLRRVTPRLAPAEIGQEQGVLADIRVRGYGAWRFDGTPSRMSSKQLAAAEFVVRPIFGRDGQPEYQIEIHLGRSAGLTLGALDAALRHAQELLAVGIT